jgi:hypothetical protein
LAENGVLAAQSGLTGAEGIPEGGDPGHGNDHRFHHPDQIGEARSTHTQLFTGQFGGTNSGPIDQIGDADAHIHERLPLRIGHPGVAVDRPIDEAGRTQRRVEPVGGMTEVSLGRSCPQTRIDAYEQELAALSDEVGHGCAAETL